MKEIKIEVVLFDEEWWIIGPDLDVECGPYDRKADAISDMRGLQRFCKFEDKPGYVTCDSFRKKRL
jgi:hypothetical protein